MIAVFWICQLNRFWFGFTKTQSLKQWWLFKDCTVSWCIIFLREENTNTIWTFNYHSIYELSITLLQFPIHTGLIGFCARIPLMHKLFWFLSGCNSRTSTIQEPGWSRNASGCLFILPQQQTPCFVSQKTFKVVCSQNRTYGTGSCTRWAKGKLTTHQHQREDCNITYWNPMGRSFSVCWNY